MTPQERDLIADLFNRLKAADAPGKDAEADGFIARQVQLLPSAPYLLVQTVLVQDHALVNAQSKIAELEDQLSAARAQAAAPAASGNGSFLGRLLGGAPAAAPAAAASPGPWSRPSASQAAAPQGGGYGPPTGGYAQPGYPPPGYGQPAYAPQPGYQPTSAMAPSAGGGFLRSAVTTAAGVAGGALLFEGISSLLHHNSGAFGPGLAQAGFNPPGEIVENTTVNNYYSGSPPGQGGGDTGSAGYSDDGGSSGSGYRDADYPQQNYGSPDTGYQEASYDGGGSSGSDDSDWT